MRPSILLLSVYLWSWLPWVWSSPPTFSSSPPSSRPPQPKARRCPLPPAPPTSLWSLFTMAVPPLATSSPSQKTLYSKASFSQWPTPLSLLCQTLWFTVWGTRRSRMPCAELWAETFLNPSTLFIKNSMYSWCTQPQVCPVQSVLQWAVHILLQHLHYKNCQLCLHIFQTFVQAFSIFWVYKRSGKMGMLF